MCLCPLDIEHKLETLVLTLREMNIPIFRFMVLNYVNRLIIGTDIALLFKDHQVKRNWYYNWLKRCPRLTNGNLRQLKVTRAKWATPENIKIHYDMLEERFIELGLAVRNPAFKPDEPFSESIKIIKPGRIASMDETRLTNDTTDATKSKNLRLLMGKQNGSSCVAV